jgi:hypothetical protein
MATQQTQETLEIALRVQETVALMLAAGCTADEIWAWFLFQPDMRIDLT